MLDIIAVAFILLPLYGNPVDGYFYSVNLLSFTATTIFNLTVYWIVFTAMIVLGIAKIVSTHLDKEIWSGITTKCSLILSIVAICFFAAARESYVTAFMFLLFVAKIFVWIKQMAMK